ncbi:MAG: class I SAM-dependent methyltransferase [Cyclobacteriaceae bacterium]
MKGDYYHTKESVQEYIQLAKNVNGKALIEQLKKVLAPRSDLLELGSGPGTDWEILSRSFHVTGSDHSSEFLDHLKTTHPTGEFFELDATTLTTEEQFDGIYSNKVLHHLSDNQLKDSVKRQHKILNPDGIICHSFWKGEGDEVFKGMFVNYHTQEDLHNLFDPYFEIISIHPYMEFEDGDSLLLIGRKKG